jgi:hypothetical protein
VRTVAGAAMADRDGDAAYWARLEREDLPHCGQCDRTRHVEGDDGRLTRCPTCHPLQGDPMPQALPRPGEPPPSARTTRWAEAAAEARRMLEDRPRPGKPAGQAAALAALTGEALARAQLAEARAARLEHTDPPGGQPPADDYPF